MWVDTRDCVPLADGRYYIQTVYGDVSALFYTFKGGWNTHYVGNKLMDDKALDSDYVVRWFKVSDPPEVPEKWFDEYWERRLENEVHA